MINLYELPALREAEGHSDKQEDSCYDPKEPVKVWVVLAWNSYIHAEETTN